MTTTNQLVRYTYNELAKRGIKSIYTFDDWEHLDRLTHRLKPKAKILDVGCGNGLPVDKYLYDRGFEVLGIDISEEYIKKARENVPQARFAVMDMQDITLPKESFDGALVLYSLFHVPKGIHKDILDTINSLLKPGGFLLITFGQKELETTKDEFEDLKLYWSEWGKEKSLGLLTGFTILYQEVHKLKNEDHLIVMAYKN